MAGSRRRTEFFGNALVWLSGGALAVNLLFIGALLAILGYYGLRYFWPSPLVELRLAEGPAPPGVHLRDPRVVMGEIWEREEITDMGEDGAVREPRHRIKLRVGNRDLYGLDYAWIDEDRIEERRLPEEAVVLERLEYGPFFGFLVEVREPGRTSRGEAAWTRLGELVEAKAKERARIERFEEREIGDVQYELERLRLRRRGLELRELEESERARRLARIARREQELRAGFEELAGRLREMRARLLAETLVLRTADGQSKEIPAGHVVRAYRPNAMTAGETLGLYLDRLWEFVADEPRESNTEGGIFPAIFGTVLMVFLMTIAVTPLGVLAALYLREYAKQGPLVRMVRIAVNNLAGVPSIVFGVFGLGFFVYVVGGTIDRLFYPEALPTPTFGTGGILWAALTLALLTVPVVIVATEEGLAAVPRAVREGSLALGATKWETTRRVVLPAAMPGVLTGIILAIARAAGEVAPLMIVGMVKLADLPLDHHPPWLHLEAKFMHLGFHIYDVGFQSPNVEATRPLVYATATLLVAIVVVMNLVAIRIRNHLRAKYATSAV